MSDLLIAAAAGSPAPSSSATFLVVLLIVAAFGGAYVAAKRARLAPTSQTLPGRLDAPLIPDDLLTAHGASATEPITVRVFEYSLMGVLAGYAFFDRGFAWFHLPGTPLFVGELVIIAGMVALVTYPTPMLTAIRRSAPLKMLLAYMAWGAVLLVLLGAPYGVDAIRDSVLWYYGAVAVLAVFLIVADPLRIQRWAGWFAKIIPWLIGWLFVAVTLDSVLGGGQFLVPDSQVSLFSHSAGNSGVISVVCLAFIWLVDRHSRYYTPIVRIALTAGCGALLLFVALKNRGGFVAGAVGIMLILVFMYRRRSELLITLIGIAALLATVALVSQVSVALFGARELSAEQFVTNITSIVNPKAGGHRQTTTTEWRLELWTRVLTDVNSEFPITGYGPGPDIGKIYNVTTNVDVPLRNPHNSHVGVIARFGWVGFGLWVVMWSVWSIMLLDLRSRLGRAGRHSDAGLVALPFVGATMMLVNAFFDPSIEGPQVGFWLWFMFGLGAALHLVYHGFPRLSIRREQPGDTVPEQAIARA